MDLRKRVIGLAGMPDDHPGVPGELAVIAQLAADFIAAVSYASVTGVREGDYVTVAATSDLALAVDRAQYADESGPCLDAFSAAQAADVPDISDVSATMAWPGFRQAAVSLGLQASLSLPLFAGRGTPVASLNLYSHHSSAMRPLSAAVRSIFGEEQGGPPGAGGNLDAGEKGLVAGLTGAFAVRAIVQQAIGVITAGNTFDREQAYEALCRSATGTHIALPQVAARVISGRPW